jgi:pyridoxine 5-phosphate synthase
MKGTIQKWKFMILLGALLFLSNMTFAEDKINHYTEGIPIDTTEVSISDKTNIPDRLYVDSLSLKRHFIHRIGIEARPGYIFPTSSFFRGENLNWKPIENSLSLHLKYSFQFHPNTYTDRIYRGAYQGIGVAYYNMYEKPQLGNPLTVYLFQGARIARFNQRLSLNYEWNFGASFGWKPYHSEAFGAEGITVHPRPDERHIRRSDVYELRPLLTTEFNIEGYPAPEFVDLVLKVKPHQVTLVPDAPDQITSNAGWDTKANLSFLTELMDTFGQAGIRTSIFVGTDKEMIEYAAKAGADRVELYTEPYATMYPQNPEAAIAPFIEAAKVTRSLGMGLNAGHDLSLVNLKYMHTHIPWLDEVSIGHALISDALYMGLKQTIEEYKNCLLFNAIYFYF